MKRYKFLELFQENPNGILIPLRRIEINGVKFRSGVSFKNEVPFGGINFYKNKYKDIAAREEDGSLVFIGFYN